MNDDKTCNTFVCAMCGEEFVKDRTDAEAAKEKDMLWPYVPMDKCELVCEDCWQKVAPEWLIFAEAD